jgi:hypothetical protein
VLDYTAYDAGFHYNSKPSIDENFDNYMDTLGAWIYWLCSAVNNDYTGSNPGTLGNQPAIGPINPGPVLLKYSGNLPQWLGLIQSLPRPQL